MEERLEVLENELERLKDIVMQVLSEIMVIKLIQTKEASFSPCRRAEAEREAEIIDAAVQAEYQRREALGLLTTKPQRSAWIDQQLYKKEEE